MSDLITILGPTASGKTPFAVELALQIDGEIISGDSRQLYRHMDIGTGKDLKEYTIDDTTIGHHLIDIRDPGEKYSLFDFMEDFHDSYKDILAHKKKPILCGGTGLYIESVIKGYDLKDVPKNPQLREELQKKSLEELTAILTEQKKLHNRTDIENKRRAIRAIEIVTYQNQQNQSQQLYHPIDSMIIGVFIEREMRRKKITSRLQKRLEEGMIDEVQAILSMGIAPDDLIYYGLEYKFVTLHVIGELTYAEMFVRLETAIHQFAKRQMTWFRGMERRGLKINWIDALLPMEQKVEQAMELIQRKLKDRV